MSDFIRKVCPDSRLECKIAEGSGEITGYAAIWDIVDQDNEIIRRGAFARAISNQVAAGKVSLMVRHWRQGGDVLESIGTIAEAKEDDIGLWFRAPLDSDEASQTVRGKIKSNPAKFGASVGWARNGSVYREGADGGGEWIEMNLKEVTITLMPAQEMTVGTMGAKNDKVADLESRVAALEEKVSKQDAAVPEGASGEPTVDRDYASEIAHRKRELNALRRRQNGSC
jgi:HK97 family phage prohead protease